MGNRLLEHEKAVSDNGSTQLRWEAEVNFWKAECYKYMLELRNANRGIVRLVRNKDKYKDTARACKESYKNGLKERSKVISDQEEGIALASNSHTTAEPN